MINIPLAELAKHITLNKFPSQIKALFYHIVFFSTYFLLRLQNIFYLKYNITTHFNELQDPFLVFQLH